MAIYRFSAQIISRSQGRSIVAAAAYRSGEELVDERTGVIHDFTDKSEVVHKEILLPENAPFWMSNRSDLWNAVESYEKRKDAQLAREVQLTLPRELSIKQNMELVREFVTNEFVEHGMVADVSLHNPKSADGLNQPHAHVLLCLRDVNEEGFGFKNRTWNDNTLLEHWREEWSNTLNRHLALHGIDQKVDHRSYKEQGIALEPQYKIGPKDAQSRMARLADHQRIARENGQLIFERPEIALDAITRCQSTFTHQDLACFINRHTENAEQFNLVFERVKSSSEIILLGLDKEGKQRFSTRDMLRIESSMMHQSDMLHHRLGHEVSEKSIMLAQSSRTLSEEQKTALHYLTAPGDLKSLLGYAGTGKSYLLGAARQVWEQSGYRVQGAALSGIAALNLRDSSGIESRTIASLFYRLDKGLLHLNSRDILVVDEAGMLGSRTMERLTREVEQSGAKLVLVGDWQQLQAIEAGASFRAIAENYQYVELNQIRRQTTSWQIDASLDLAQGAVDKALLAYDAHDHVHRFASTHDAKQALIEQWNDVRMASPTDSQIILAYTRKDVKELNEMARRMMRNDRELGDDVVFTMERGERAFAVNDRVYFLKREDSLSVINGSLGTIKAIDAQSGVITVALDCDETKPKIVQVNTNYYKHMEHGYAATVYKAQGVTVDRAYVLPTAHYDAHSTYVAMTRHRKSCDVFVSREVFAHDKALIQALRRNRAKDVTLDYTHIQGEFARQRGLVLDKSPTLSIASEEHFKTTERSLESLMNQVMGRDLQKEQQKLNAFAEQCLRENPSQVLHIADSLLSNAERQAKSLAHSFEPYSKILAQNRLTSEQKEELIRLTEQLPHDSQLMNAFKKDYPEFAKQAEQFIQRNEQQIQRIRSIDKELDL
ncbi:Ti-type conjugative transfer relaxase TraA [Fluoribacter gormanii]|uniref:Ti-type conjugative transfer relaxase TraA n=1 Tax=Fluoribacter gormanii TaxID=464 RepID=UPI0022441BAF|nr:Ti-type conjugative transfer relaxase TraA [Fluoribacter gormanii]MCW8445689.1 Ti-type conjugative transfer relaxase TraA [Fluoribacter gormanii]